MSALLLNAGIFSTIQDGGRHGYQHKGVSPAGAMDLRSYKLANILVNSDEDAPCIEISYGGVKIEFSESMDIAVTGASFEIKINNKMSHMNQTLHIISGDVLEVGLAEKGVYGYIAFSKNFKASKVLGSYSTDISSRIGGIKGSKLKTGDRLFFEQNTPAPSVDRKSTETIVTSINDLPTIRFIEGCEYKRFNLSNQEKFENECFKMSEMSDRMGYRLTNNPVFPLDGNDILSQGLTLGTIQGTPSGDVIVMLADRQTTGGYTRIGNIISVDLGRFAQLKAGKKVRFKKVTLEESHVLLKTYRDEFDSWKRSLEASNQKIVVRESQMKIHVNNRAYNVRIQEVE